MSKTINITRSTALESDVYDFAIAAFKLLFAPRNPDPSILPPDLLDFENVYCSGSEGCFLVAREEASSTSISTSTSTVLPSPPPTPASASPASGKIVGICAYRPYRYRFDLPSGQPRPYLQWPDKRTVEVVRLFVSPECRGQRLAQRIVQRMVEEAKGDKVDVLYLHTQPFLTGAEELWAKMGWSLIERDTDQWESIHMVRKL